MQVHTLLENRKTEILTEIEKLRTEMAEIDRMLGVRSQVSGKLDASTVPEMKAVPSTKDEAILVAIDAGMSAPQTISDYIRNNLGMSVNDASTRTRLSRMKAAGKISHDGNGWKR